MPAAPVATPGNYILPFPDGGPGMPLPPPPTILPATSIPPNASIIVRPPETPPPLRAVMSIFLFDLSTLTAVVALASPWFHVIDGTTALVAILGIAAMKTKPMKLNDAAQSGAFAYLARRAGLVRTVPPPPP